MSFRIWATEVAAPIAAYLATHPAAFGFVAGLARWSLGDRLGGLRSLFTYVVTSIVVAWAASFWLAGEALPDGRRNFYLLLAAFVAKDLLIALVGISTQFGTDPWAVIKRIRAALAGGPK